MSGLESGQHVARDHRFDQRHRGQPPSVLVGDQAQVDRRRVTTADRVRYAHDHRAGFGERRPQIGAETQRLGITQLRDRRLFGEEIREDFADGLLVLAQGEVHRCTPLGRRLDMHYFVIGNELPSCTEKADQALGLRQAARHRGPQREFRIVLLLGPHFVA